MLEEPLGGVGWMVLGSENLSGRRAARCAELDSLPLSRLQLHLPRLGIHWLPEQCVRFGLDEIEARCLVDLSRRLQLRVRPEDNFLIARLARESDDLVDEPRSDAEAACGRLYQEQSQLRESFAL